ncbi:DUF732 domain-containing protein [Mycobacterium sp. BMJ-28]
MLTFLAAVAVAAAAVLSAAPASADTDTRFANELHTYGIYGQKDYNAWIAKLTCKRLQRGVDQSAYDSAHFVSTNMPKTTSTEQAWQFLGGALRSYCPEQMPVVESAARHGGSETR